MGDHDVEVRMKPWVVKIRVVFSIIGLLVGASAAVVFTQHYKNYNVGIWALLSGKLKERMF